MFARTHTRRIWKTALLPLIDFFALVLGAGFVYLIRYKWFQDNVLGFSFRDKVITGYDYLTGATIIALIVVLIYAFLGLYKVTYRIGFWEVLLKLSSGIFITLLALITFFFFNEYDKDSLPLGVPISRFILGTGGFIALYFVLLGRGLVLLVERSFYKFGIGKINIAIIGDKENFLIRHLKVRKEIKKIYNYIDLDDKNYRFLENSILSGSLDEVYIMSQNNNREPELAKMCERYKVSFIFSPQGFTDYQAFDLKPLIIGRKTFLEMKYTSLDGWQVVLKRLFDLLFSIIFLMLFSWVYIIIAVIVKLDSKGPIFYGNKRVGPNGKVFKLWKFRRFKLEYCTDESNPKSLDLEKELIAKQDMRGDGILYKIENDPRMTNVGRFLEKFSLDELPQFFNVFIGNMSVVGPRPHQPREVAKYMDHHFKVLNIKPGITGMAQINGRSNLSFEEEVAFDSFYVEHWSFVLDLWIVIKTPFIVLFKRHKN